VDRTEFLRSTAAAGLLLAAAPDAFARRFSGIPVALVTADAEAHVAAIRLTDGRLLRTIATPAGPRSIETVGRTAVVAHTDGGAVSLLDVPGLRMRRVLRGFGAPRYTAAADGRNIAYVTDSARGEVAVVDLVRDRVVRRIGVGGPAWHITVFGDTLWTTLGTRAERIAVLDVSEPLRPRLRARFTPPFLAHDVAFTPRGARVWVSSGDRGRLAVYDASSRRRLFELAADAPPQHLTFLAGRAYVTSGDDATLRIHRLDGRLVRARRIPAGSFNVQQGGGMILTPSLSRGTLCVVSVLGGASSRVVPVASSSHDACFVMTR
jgi:DNA-binding beta-propeller fold protein YncE